MPVTVRGTDILFNDSTTQGSAPYIPPVLAAGTFNYRGAVVSASTFSTSYALSTDAFVVTRNGTVRTRSRYRGSSDGYNSATGWYRVFINGVAVGTEVSNASFTYLFINQDFSVNAGDFIQLGSRAFGSSTSTDGSLVLGVNSFAQATAINWCTNSFVF